MNDPEFAGFMATVLLILGYAICVIVTISKLEDEEIDFERIFNIRAKYNWQLYLINTVGVVLSPVFWLYVLYVLGRQERR